MTVELNVPVVEKVTRQLTHGVFPLKLATLFPAESPLKVKVKEQSGLF